MDANPNSQAATSQKVAIIAYLNNGGTLTKKNAAQLFGAEDYRKRISELRRAGYDIRDRWITGMNRYGHKERYKEYYLVPVLPF
jgi:hypothetical protein